MSDLDDMTETSHEGVPEDYKYRPNASTYKVHDMMINSAGSIAAEAVYQGGMFLSLANYYDKDKGTVIRYGHLVDASECLELALVYLDQLKAEMAIRLRVEDEQNLGTDPAF